MRELDREKTNDILNTIMEYELAGVVRYTHYSLMVTGPHRLPIVQFFQQQATESLVHAQQVGEILTGLEGHPSLKIAAMEETNEHSLHNILNSNVGMIPEVPNYNYVWLQPVFERILPAD